MTKKRKRHVDVDEIPQKGLNRSPSPCLEPKHKIFLSHSGIQKKFTERLYEDLKGVNHFPFFDKRRDCLAKGKEWRPPLFDTLRQCRVAILVLSEEYFTRTIWPMIELNEFVQAKKSDNPGLYILPLYLGLNRKQVEDALNRNKVEDAGNQKCWRETWEEWAREDSTIDVEKWVQSLSHVVGSENGMEYDRVEETLEETLEETPEEVLFRTNVVEAVCELIPPDVKYDVSHVQAMSLLCKAISRKLDEEVEPGCRVVGLFGMAGMGKTTISKAMCNANYAEFGGKVCYVEFSGNNYVELRKKVLQELTGSNQEYLPNDGDKLLYLLKSRMQRQKVFLSLDNVLSADDIEEANKYIWDMGYLDGSRLLVTSRSLDVLKSLRLRESACMEMPELEEQDATNAFLHYARCTSKSFNETQLGIIERCVEVCKFTKSELGGSECGSSERKYLPLALKVWGTQLGDIGDDPLSWVEGLKTLGEHKFNSLNEPHHPLFRVLRQGYDKLDQRDQHIFLDLAIFFPRRSLFGFTDHNIVEWLSIVYRCSRNSIKRSLKAIRRKALLEYSEKDCLTFKIHDLYLVFARLEAQAGPLHERRILYVSNGADFPRELMEEHNVVCWSSLKRLGLCESNVKSLTNEGMKLWPSVEVLQVYDCHHLVEVDVGGMKNLISLDVVGCERLGLKLRGVENLKNLAWFRWRDIDEDLGSFLRDLSGLPSLQVLHLDYTLWKHISTDPPDLSGCTELRELTMSGFHTVESLPDLENLLKLEKVYFRYARDAKSVFGLSSLTKLKVLSLYWCPEVAELPGLCDLIALETLELVDVGLSKIHGLKKLRYLRTLIVSDCKKLSGLGGLEYLIFLRVLDASGCKKLREIPDCSNLAELEMVNLSHSGVCTLPSDFERLAKHRILKIEGCAGLFEPLVVWLLDQEQQLPGGCLFSRRKWLEHFLRRSWGKPLETIAGTSTPVIPTSCRPTSVGTLPKETVSEATSRKLFAHYMEEVVLFRLNSSFHSLANPEFFDKEILPSTCILEDMDRGIEAVIAALCKCHDMGILSLVIAKYAARGSCWDLLTESDTI